MTQEAQTVKSRYDAAIESIFSAHRESSADDDIVRRKDFLLGLSPVERDVVVIEMLRGQVLNGGFQQWYENGYYEETFRFLEHALVQLGGDVASRLLDLVNEVSVVCEDLAHAEDSGDEDVYEEECESLEEFDERFFVGIADELVAAVDARWNFASWKAVS